MKIKTVKKTVWDAFFNKAGSPSFLHSWEWGEFEKSTGYPVYRFGLYDNKNILISILQVIHVRARRGNFLFVAHGPVTTSNKPLTSSQLSFLTETLIDLAKKSGCSFIRIAPVWIDSTSNRNLFSKLGYKTAPIYMHSERSWVLPLSVHADTVDKEASISNNQQESNLLAAMRKTTRYSIRKAIREKVIIESRNDREALDIFWNVYRKTAERERFVPFSMKFIKKEFEAFHKSGNCLLLLGKDPVSQKYVAAALILFTPSSGFYHQGASIHTKTPVMYLLQWEAIRYAIKRNCRYYNFWGILKKGRTPDSWEGLSLFKTGFGGLQIDYVPTQDFVLSPLYYATALYEKYLAWKRNR